QNGVRSDLVIRPSIDGRPLAVDFFQKKAGTSGPLQISQIKPDATQEATEWSLRLTMREGGFVECKDEFQFQAPDANYQPSLEIHATKGDTNWTHFDGRYYIAFGEPRKYGVMRVQTERQRATVLL